MTVAPLSRNRDFMLLQAGQLLSAAGSHASSIAYPLLVLATTQSPAKAGIVSFARLLPSALFALVAGLAADRWDRKYVMIAADALRVVAVASLVVAIAVDRLTFWQIAIVAFVEGTGSTFFAPAAAGALRAVVPRRQLPAAAGIQEARAASVRLAGPPLGGALFGLGRAVPFVVDAVSYAFSIVSLVGMRTRFQEPREVDRSPLRSKVAAGFRFLWEHPFLRTCAFLWGFGNFVGPGLLLVLVVVGREQGLSGGEIGLLLAAFAASILAGSLLSPLFRRALPVRAILLLEFWAWLGCGAFVIWPNVYVLVAAMLPVGICIPVSDSVVNGYRLALTPDRVIGRVESARLTISLVIAPFGPLAAGFLLESVSDRQTVAVFVVFAVVLAVWGTLSPSIKSAPSLDELDDAPAEPAPARGS